MTIKDQIKEKDKAEHLLRKIIFEIRGEETPGRFLEKLSQVVTEYKTNTNIGLDLTLHPDLFSQDWAADRFYYMKSSVLTGFLNALGYVKK